MGERRRMRQGVRMEVRAPIGGEGAGSRRGWNKRARDAARRGGTGRNGSEGIAEETVGGAKWGEGGTRKGKLRYGVGEGTG